MTSIADCSLLALASYERNAGAQCLERGWDSRGSMYGTGGFAAEAYQRGADRVIAFRGTEPDDAKDILADMMMVPITRPGAGIQTARALMQHYRITSSTMLTAAAPYLLEAILNYAPVNVAVRVFANSVPREQVSKALDFFGANATPSTIVTGHSLGGALAQVVAMQRSVKAVAFNSPHMGDLRGVVPATFGNIIQVNALGDPLSLATQSAGNLTHGQVITVNVAPARVEPPAFTRRPLGWQDAIAPLGRLLHREIVAQKKYHAELLDYLGTVALHYHSMDTLNDAIQSLPQFQVKV